MNTTLKALLLIVGLLVLGGVAYFFLNYFKAPIPFIQNQNEVQGEHTSGMPMDLIIDKISVTAPVQSLGLTAEGNVDVPKGPHEVSWYNLGPRPGEIGSAVITGHYGPWLNGDQSVFNDLNKLKPGDKVQVKDHTGKIFTFVVRETKIYKSTDKPFEVFNSTDGKAHLNLITCQGDWLKNEDTFADRLVVFTDLE